jgi:hypothetical protein
MGTMAPSGTMGVVFRHLIRLSLPDPWDGNHLPSSADLGMLLHKPAILPILPGLSESSQNVLQISQFLIQRGVACVRKINRSRSSG